MKKTFKSLVLGCLAALLCCAVGVAAGCQSVGDTFGALRDHVDNLVEELTHECEVFDVLKYGANGHWYECKCGAVSEEGVKAHEGGEATCLTQAVCTVCNAKYGALADHKGGEATCSELAKCEVCGKEYGILGEHSYTELKLDASKHWYECKCGVVADGSETAHFGGESTCTELAECEVCGKEYGVLKAHEYTQLVIEETEHWYECVCGEKDGVVSHFGGEATCTAKAECEVCGKEYGELKAHNFSTDLKVSTTSHWYECLDCGVKKEETDHAYTTYGNDETTHWGICECGVNAPVEKHYSDTPASCTQAAICKVCGTAFGGTAEHVHNEYAYDENGHWSVCGCGAKVEDSNASHDYAWKLDEDNTKHWQECVCGSVKNEGNHEEGTPASCLDKAVCAICNNAYGEALGHTEVAIPAVAPTCTETGLTAGVKCSVCKDILTEQEEVAALGHDYGAAWEKDENTHWHVCTREDCTAISEKVTHVGENNVSNGDDTHTSTCECGAVYTEVCSGGKATFLEKAICEDCGVAYGEPFPASRTYVFSTYPVGVQYAEETHKLDGFVTMMINEAHLNGELRLYSSSIHDGYAIFESAGVIHAITLNAGNKADTLNVYGSTDGKTWTLIEGVATTSSYTDYTVTIPDSAYTYLKLDVAGTQQVRIKYITLSFVSSDVEKLADDAKVALARDTLELASDKLKKLGETIALPVDEKYGTSITWTTDFDATIAAIDGNVFKYIKYPAETVEATLTATIVLGNITVEKTFVIDVVNFVKPTTPEDIVNAAYELGADETLDGGTYTLTGVITAVDDAYNTQFGNVTVTIQIGELADKQIKCYRLKGEGADIINVGDTITVTGTLTNYKGNSVQFAQGCTLDEAVISDASKIAADIAALKITEKYTSAEVVTLPTSGANGSAIAWAWKDDAAPEATVATLSGNTLTILAPSAETTIVLEATFTLGTATPVAKEITITIELPVVLPEKITEAPVVGNTYKMWLYQETQMQLLYTTGAMNDYYYATSENAEEAAIIYVEAAEGGFYLYHKVDDANKYLNIVQSGTYTNVKYEDAASSVWVWDETLGTVKTTLGDEVFCLGTFGTYTTISANKTNKTGLFVAYLTEVVVSGGDVTVDSLLPVEGKAYYLAYTDASYIAYATGLYSGGKYLTTDKNATGKDAAATIYFEKAEGSSNQYYIKVNDQYLNNVGNKNVTLAAEKTTAWTVDTTNNQIKYIDGTTTYYLQYNANSPRVTTYDTGSQKNVWFVET